jgi:hypothetical protein
VVAAMRRQAPKGDFRSNLHRGGSAKAVRVSEAEQATAVRAASVLGLGVAGVDLIRSKRGPLVLEVNSSPGLEGIEAATGIDIAAGTMSTSGPGTGCAGDSNNCSGYLDLLFVIDNSGSMGEEQLNLARNMPLLVQQLENLTDDEGNQIDLDTKLADELRRRHPRHVVALRVLLPVDEVRRRGDPLRVRKDPRPAVRRGPQTDELRRQPDVAVVTIVRDVLQRDVDAHRTSGRTAPVLSGTQPPRPQDNNVPHAGDASTRL